MNTTSKWFLGACVAIAAVCSAACRRELENAGAAPVVESASLSSAGDRAERVGGQGTVEPSGQAAVNASMAGAGSAAGRQPARDLYSGYSWDPLAPGIAADAQDAAWLSARGYPDSEVYFRLSVLPMADLQALAEGGNLAAQGVYAYRLAKTGAAPAEVQSMLMRSAANGSAYALKVAGDIYQTVPEFRDPVMAMAYYGLMASEGDQSGFAQGYLFGQGMLADDRLRSRIIEEQLRAELAALKRRASSRSSVVPSQRPGYQAFLQAAARPGEAGRE